MKSFKIIFIIMISLNFSTSISLEDKREIFVNNIKSFISSSSTLPADYTTLVEKVTPEFTILFQGIKQDRVGELKVRYGLSDDIITQIKTSQYVSGSNVYSKISSQVVLGLGKFEETIGAAFREGDMIYFALIRSISKAVLRIKYENICWKDCKRILFIKKCKHKCKDIEQSYTPEEIEKITQIEQYFSSRNLLSDLDILKEKGYQAYITQGNGVYSDDGQSVAFITDYGDIAIGPSSEVNAVLPVEYYDVIEQSGDVIKRVRNEKIHVKQCKTENNCYNFNQGKWHLFNFVVNKYEEKNFEESYDLIEKKRKEGSYFIKILNDGNIIMYKKQENSISTIWSSNSKGEGPFDLKLSNEKILSLEDKSGNSIYKTSTYKSIPTVSYKLDLDDDSDVKSIEVYNGQPLEVGGIHFYEITLSSPQFQVELNMYVNLYVADFKPVPYWITGHKKPANLAELMNMKVQIVGGNNEYDICYKGLINGVWTNYVCNGKELVEKKQEISMISIIIKKK